MPKGTDAHAYRERLINALAFTISQDGYHGAKIQDVAREAKVSLRTFYAEFPNKEACYLAFYEKSSREIEAAVTRDIDPAKPWRDHMAAGFESYFRILALSPKLTHAALIELLTLSDHARQIRQEAVGRFQAMLCAEVEVGRAAHPEVPSRSLTPAMALALIGGLTELMLDLVQRDEIGRLPKLVEVATDLLWSVVTNVSTPAETAS